MGSHHGLNKASNGLAVLNDASEMAINIGLARIVGGDRQMGASERSPLLCMTSPTIGVSPSELCLSLHSKTVHASSDLCANGPDLLKTRR